MRLAVLSRSVNIPHKDGIMADQLNYVMKEYKKYNSKEIKKYAYEKYDKSTISKKIIKHLSYFTFIVICDR